MRRGCSRRVIPVSLKRGVFCYNQGAPFFYFMGRKKKEAPVPDGLRRLELTYLEPIPIRCVGVYCLFFGNHFYIGMSTNVRARLSKHRLEIDRLLYRTLYGREGKPTGSYPIIVRHLIDNKHIVTMDACLLYAATSENDALCEEFCWHSILRDHPLSYFCLNKLHFFPADDQLILDPRFLFC